MILYDQRRCASLILIFQCAGSVFSRIWCPATVSCVLTVGIKLARDHGYGIGEVFIHPYPNQFFTFLLGFMLVFRTHLTCNRFWEGRTQLEIMTSKWTDVATQVVVFDAVKGDEADLLRWKRQVLSAISLLHAVSLASLGGLVSLEVLAGIDTAQVDAGLNHPRLPKHGEFKTAVALQWVQDIITTRMREGLAVPPPILSRVFQELSTGHLGYRNALKIHHTPFPFPYSQIIALALTLLVPAAGIMMDYFVVSKFWACVFCFIAVGGYYGVNEVAIELEDPFGRDDNDLSMELYHREFNEKLLMLHHKHLPHFSTPAFDQRFSVKGPCCAIGSDPDMLTSHLINADIHGDSGLSLLRWVVNNPNDDVILNQRQVDLFNNRRWNLFSRLKVKFQLARGTFNLSKTDLQTMLQSKVRRMSRDVQNGNVRSVVDVSDEDELDTDELLAKDTAQTTAIMRPGDLIK